MLEGGNKLRKFINNREYKGVPKWISYFTL